MTKNLPKISIITPSYNQGVYLEKTILSVIEQDYPNVEHIIVDGGSTDNSVDVIKKYQDKIAYWISEKDKGTFDANNKALEKVTGDFWCIVNSDDILLPGALKKVAVEINENPEVKWFCGGEYHIDENDRVTGKHNPIRPEKTIEGFTFLDACWISHPTVFLHKEIIELVGKFKKYHLMDLNYWLRMERAGFKPYIIKDYLAALRIHSDCKSADRVQLTKEFLRVVSDFSKENNLDKSEKVKEAFKSSQIFLYTLLLNDNLARRNIKTSIKMLKKIWDIRSSVIFQRWYWGGIKRVFSMSPNDPLFNDFPFNGSGGNWND